MRFEINLAEGLRIFDHETQAEVPLRSYAGIIVLLACSVRPVTRTEILQKVWPKADISVARNRLRVALTKLRSQLPNGIHESPLGLTLNPDVLSVDIWDIGDLMIQSEATVTMSEEFDMLREIAYRFGDGTPFASYRSLAPEFCLTLVQALMRAITMTEKSVDQEEKYRIATIAVRIVNDNPELWKNFLLIAWQLGTVDSAIKSFRSIADPAMSDDPEIRETLRQVRLRLPEKEQSLDSAQRDMVIELFEALENERRDQWLSIFASPQSLGIAGKYPLQMHDLLERALKEPVEQKGLEYQRCLARFVGLKAWLGDVDGVLEFAPKVFELATEPVILRATWNAVAIAYSLRREWSTAQDALSKTAQYAEMTGNELDVVTVSGVNSYFRLQQGYFDEAFMEYTAQLERLKEIDSPRSRFEYAIAIGHRSFAPVFSGDWLKAIECLREAIQVRSEMAVQMGLLQAALATSQMQIGLNEGVTQLVRLSFIEAFTSKSIPTIQWSFELAAGALVCTDRCDYGHAVLQWTKEWRSSTNSLRSTAEESLCTRFRDQVPKNHRSILIAKDTPPADIGKDLLKSLRIASLRS